MNNSIMGRIEFGPAYNNAVPEHTMVGWPPYYVQSAPVEAVTEISRLRRELAELRPPVDEFREFLKIARLSRECVITEKIDGTNACILITEDGGFFTGSRTRWITPDDDNFGFSRWAHDHKDELLLLGPGRHFGEWWGAGIQRNYGLAERRFSLFNTGRWWDSHEVTYKIDTPPLLSQVTAPACCYVVPVVWRGVFSTESVDKCVFNLSKFGSQAAPGFMKPEGVVIYHTAADQMFKQTLEHDDEPKLARVKKERAPKPPRDPNTGGRRKGLTDNYNGPLRRAIENY